MLRSKFRWLRQEADEEKVKRLADALHLSQMTARLLVLRELDEPDQADAFLHPEKSVFHDPMRMLGMREAASRIQYAIHHREPIRVFGDYDADGVTSTALLVRALKKMGGNISWYIPNRFRDGYGPNIAAVEQAKKDGVALIVTVDSGIAAPGAAERAGSLGIDYIVTDHHEPPPDLPDAFAILNPKQPGCGYPFKGLSGAGVALKLAQALFQNHVNPDWIALASIGTIADLVPLRDENRLIAARGLELINTGSLAGIEALKMKAGSGSPINEETVAFQLAPRLNAAGRMADADIALNLLLADDPSEAAGFVGELEEMNRRRRSLVDAIARSAEKKAAAFYERGDKALVIAGEGWHEGVIGIVASRIVEKYYRPAIILSIDPESGMAKGSGRSIEGFNLYEGLSAAQDHLTQFGGHPMAAGLSLPADEIDAFREDFKRTADSLDEEMLIPGKNIDSLVDPDQVTVEQIDELSLLSPFGTGNPRPVFLMEALHLSKMSGVGREQAHLKVALKGEKNTLDGIGFGMGPMKKEISPADRVSVVGELSVNEWNGFRKPQLMIADLAVDGLQLFDWRSDQKVHEKIRQLPRDRSAVISFHPEMLGRLQIAEEVTPYHPGVTIRRPNLVLLDLPDEEEQLSELLAKSPDVHRIYAVFHHKNDHYFSTFPTRNHFIWYYALIRRDHSFRLSAMVKKISRFKGWSSSSVYFMTKVFLELDFVKIEGDILTENRMPKKAPLSESPTYRNEKKQLELEELFCYSSLSSLKAWFDKQDKRRKTAKKPEGTLNGL
ncbi:single-stranded-DNA-specific exonuclease RecJ [Sporolactobacillus sp. THM7-7]|nr:single-stranded-DNA-specific exonuclease RecJ [Sporolactobacillus sp. THM7-7]